LIWAWFKIGIGQDLLLPLCPKSIVEYFNPTKTFGVDNVVPMPPSIKKPFPCYAPQPQ
jgi:hypothetical protein